MDTGANIGKTLILVKIFEKTFILGKYLKNIDSGANIRKTFILVHILENH